MSENLSPAEKEFRDRKARELKEHPEKADKINLATTIAELFLACREDEDEIEDENDVETPKKLGIVEHVHRMAKEEKEDEDDDFGSVDLSKTGGSVPLLPTTPKTQTWESHEQMIDDLFKAEMLAKIESTRRKPDVEVIKRGEKATSMIEQLYKSGMKQNRLTKARKDLVSGRIELEEPEWIRKLMNPLGTKRLKEKPYLRG